ncbi:hypothetical protein ACVJGD_002154 [Bradyrhizobium sp. USDA 10063]
MATQGEPSGYSTLPSVRCFSIASDAFSASAKVLNGDPPTLIAGLFRSMGRHEGNKAGLSVKAGAAPTLVADHEREAWLFALQIWKASIGPMMRLNCMMHPKPHRTLLRFGKNAAPLT